MASTLSNLYVEKASSEHPLALWMLNEQVDYVSQITEEERQFQLYAVWELENAEATAELSTSYNVPFPESATSRIIGDIPATINENIVLRSQFNLSNNLVASLSNFSLGFYLYLETALCNSVSFGYQYTLDSVVVEDLTTKTTLKTDTGKWKFFSGTFNLPPEGATDIRLLIKINVSQGGVAGDYDFLVNGLSVGQWSEDFNKISYGVTPDDIPATINLPSVMKALPAYPYGASGENGYYLSQGYQLLCKNLGVPLVFGSSNLTKVFPNVYNGVNYPSLIFPGSGFLNERGRFNDYTVEMWVRINAATSQARRIFGPITGNDGLYVDGAFLTFKVDGKVGSHFIGEWFRPMLVHIRLLHNSVIVLLNGEEVISLEFDQATIDLPSEYSGAKNQDWLGFYAYDDVTPIEIDTFSVYSYGIPTEVAKRRWVWGQAVPAPEQTNSSINSITAFNDYAFANYASNYNYPDFANWKQAFYSNVEAESRELKLPDYKLPEFQLGSKTSQEWFDDIQAITPTVGDFDDTSGLKYLTLKPNSGWSLSSDFIHFNNFGVLNDPVETIYGIFKTDGTELNKPLIKIINKYSKDYILISLSETTVTYSTNLSGVTTTITTKTIEANKKFTVGLNIKLVSLLEVGEINRFFTDQSALDVYVAGDSSTKFNGKIYKIGFNAAYNNRKIASHYDSSGIFKTAITASISNVTTEDGFITYTTSESHGFFVGDVVTISGITSTASGVFNLANQTITKITDTSFTIENAATGTYTSGGSVTDYSNILTKHTANYTLAALNKYGIFFADIAVAGYWEDYMPLSYFAKAIVDYDGNTNSELDSIQYNQDFPEPPASAQSQTTSVWTYSDLQIAYSNPTILTYAELNNAFYTKWDNYLEMSQNSVKTSYFSTDDSALRSYVSFQYIANGANNNLVDFNNYAKPLTTGILDPESVNLDWQETAYEITTGTVIYPPKKITRLSGATRTTIPVDFNDLAIVYHLDFKSDGILHQQIKFKELQLASHVLERTDFTPVGSRFGIPVYYYTKSGLYYDLKAKNPIETYKKSTPYLYLNKQSGWKIRGDFNSLTDRGLAIPINLSKAEKTEVSTIQMWLRFAQAEFPEDPIMVFSIDHNYGIYDFYIQADSSLQRGRIFGVNRETTEILSDIEYYINGQSVGTPYLVNGEWVVLGLEFYDLLNFSSSTGRLSLNGPLTYNNVSYNLATNIEKDEALETRTWNDMLSVHVAGVTNITTTGTQATYFTTNTYIPGERVTISGVVPGVYDVVNATVISASGNNFTIASTETAPYVSGGIVKSGKWEDLQTDLVVIENNIQPYKWSQVKIISQSRTFNIDPKAIYEKYTGSNRIVIDDDSSGILVKPEKFKILADVSWSTNTKIAV